MAALANTIACIEKKRLQDAYSHAVSEYNRMNTAEALAVMRGAGFHFTELIAEAAKRKEDAKYALIQHEEEHGC
jgi:hypothetical protein